MLIQDELCFFFVGRNPLEKETNQEEKWNRWRWPKFQVSLLPTRGQSNLSISLLERLFPYLPVFKDGNEPSAMNVDDVDVFAAEKGAFTSIVAMSVCFRKFFTKLRLASISVICHVIKILNPQPFKSNNFSIVSQHGPWDPKPQTTPPYTVIMLNNTLYVYVYIYIYLGKLL